MNRKRSKHLLPALLLLAAVLPAGGCTQNDHDSSLYGEYSYGSYELITAKDGSGPYLFHIGWNVTKPGAKWSPERFYLWNEGQHTLVPLDVYYASYVQSLRSDPSVMDALRERLVTAYYESTDSGGSLVPIRSFFVTRGDNVGALGPEALAQKYYEEGDGLSFDVVFSMLEEETQREWLEYAYREEIKNLFDDILHELHPDQEELIQWARRAYDDDKVAISDSLARCHLDADVLPVWLSQAQEDGRIVFQTLLENAIQDRKK